jgi:membrane-bound lytic murein transglycosylase F
LVAIVALTAISPRLCAQKDGDRYDHTFRKYSKRFFGVGFDWRLFKAQGLTESRLDPMAKSGVGAAGIMQLMPSTFQEIQSKNSEWTSVDDAEWNIAAGIYYDRQLWRQWHEDVADDDHPRFMLASYNAGRGTILSAQRVAIADSLDPRSWTSVETVAPKVPRWRHRETVDYVKRNGENLARLDDKGRIVR